MPTSPPPVILVTGSSRGLGRGVAETLAEAGFSVAIHYASNKEAAETTAAACRKLAPNAEQKFAIVGGTALHDKVGQAWWEELAGVLRTHFRTAYYSEGLVAAIKLAGHALKQHFPAENVDRSGQSDIVEE